MTTLGAVLDLLEQWYPAASAEGWDAVGLVSGHPDDPVERILLAVDPVQPVADEAAAFDADLLVVHHPLFLRGVHGVAATTPKGRTLHTLTGAGCALFTAHTNADRALGGVSEALARAVGVRDPRPVLPDPHDGAGSAGVDKLTVFVPEAHAERVREAVADAGAGSIGDYDRCSYSTTGEGRFRPGANANPAIGRVGDLEVVPEVRIEAVLPRPLRAAVVAALVAAHPYEEPAYDVIELAVPTPGAGRTGQGRIGEVTPTTLAGFVDQVAAALPGTAHGVRFAGDPQRRVERVAVCGGAGDFMLDDVLASGADVYLTSDLRHHVAGEFLERSAAAGGPALVDVAHWAAEWTWLPVLAERLVDAIGPGVEVSVSTLVTDPWTGRV